jgi:hypothetical protein
MSLLDISSSTKTNSLPIDNDSHPDDSCHSLHNITTNITTNTNRSSTTQRRKSTASTYTSRRKNLLFAYPYDYYSRYNHSKALKAALIVLGLSLLSTLLFGIYYQARNNVHNAAPTIPFWQQPHPHLSDIEHSRITKSKYYLTVLQQLQLAGVHNLERLQDPTGPAHKALLWMAWTLEHEPSPKNTETTRAASNTILLQQFALATLYFATNGSEWKYHQHWLTASSTTTSGGGEETSTATFTMNVCDWHGVQCEILDQSDWFGGYNLSEEPDTQQLQLQLQPMMEVVRLSLSNSNLIGTVPEEIQYLSQLMSIDLSYNELSGTLPPNDNMGHYLRLTDLQLQHNQFTGRIPASLGHNLITRQLLLHHNQFQGSVPSSLGTMINLQHLALQNNRLTGQLPSLAMLKQITQLELQHNELSGSIPFEICTLHALGKTKQNKTIRVWTVEWMGVRSAITHILFCLFSPNISSLSHITT